MTDLTLDDIQNAAQNISNYLQPTPLVPLLSLTNSSIEVYGKLEITHNIGVFKIRGAINALAKLKKSQLKKGVICVSTGNHGRALAYGAKILKGRAVVCMSNLVPQNKLNAIKDLGAEIVIHGKSQDEAQLKVNELIKKEKYVEIPPFDHKDVIAGQGTIGLEILNQLKNVDSILVPLSGGGLVSGIAFVCKQINPSIKVIAVSAKRTSAMATSIRLNKPTDIEEVESIADSLGGGIGLNNQFTFKLVSKYVDKILLLDEKDILAGMKYLFFKENIVVEGAGAVGVSVLMTEKYFSKIKDLLGKKVVVILSGKNVDMHNFLNIMNS